LLVRFPTDNSVDPLIITGQQQHALRLLLCPSPIALWSSPIISIIGNDHRYVPLRFLLVTAAHRHHHTPFLRFPTLTMTKEAANNTRRTEMKASIVLDFLSSCKNNSSIVFHSGNPFNNFPTMMQQPAVIIITP
jgi:hypothetical protein